jgi:RNA polymerase sigma-70 factor (ECF subfamily)
VTADAEPRAGASSPAPTAAAQRASFDEFYAAQYGNLTVQLYMYFGDRQEAHDIVQEAFCRAYARWRIVSQYEDPIGWVRRVAWNQALSKWRRTKTALRFLNRQPRVEPQVDGPSPERVMVMGVLATLPEQQRRVFVLRYVADLTVAEIADHEGVAEGTVKSWLHRGKAVLAAQLDLTGDAAGGER